MKSRPILLLAVLTGVAAAADPVVRTSMRTTLAAEIRQDATYTPSPPAPAPTVAPAPDEEIVALEPYVVTNPPDTLARKIAEQEKKFLAEKFDLVNGGTILKKAGRNYSLELKLKFDPEHKGWDLLSISW